MIEKEMLEKKMTETNKINIIIENCNESRNQVHNCEVIILMSKDD
jgi:hypothetical protein